LRGTKRNCAKPGRQENGTMLCMLYQITPVYDRTQRYEMWLLRAGGKTGASF
jgi:hypothetical protein